MAKMNTYVVLVRGVNVGGKNIVPMAALRTALEELGFENVASYIASGNLILDSSFSAAKTQAAVEDALVDGFKMDRETTRTLVLTRNELEAVIEKRPRGFGNDPAKYLCDAVFLMGITATAAMRVFKPAEGIDEVWPGDGVIYSRRLAAQRTKSRLNRIVGTPEYRSMTIRNWNTTVKLLELLKSRSQHKEE
jgi:uncharacterized protein (DUF1697 family)